MGSAGLMRATGWKRPRGAGTGARVSWAGKGERKKRRRAGGSGLSHLGWVWAGVGKKGGSRAGLLDLDFLSSFSFLILVPNQTQPKLVEFKLGFEFHSNTQTKSMLHHDAQQN